MKRIDRLKILKAIKRIRSPWT